LRVDQETSFVKEEAQKRSRPRTGLVSKELRTNMAQKKQRVCYTGGTEAANKKKTKRKLHKGHRCNGKPDLESQNALERKKKRQEAAMTAELENATR